MVAGFMGGKQDLCRIFLTLLADYAYNTFMIDSRYNPIQSTLGRGPFVSAPNHVTAVRVWCFGPAAFLRSEKWDTY
jgi:hypothetical protein